MNITIRSPWLLKHFWGRRDSYPSYVTASLGTWYRWWKTARHADREGGLMPLPPAMCRMDIR